MLKLKNIHDEIWAGWATELGPGHEFQVLEQILCLTHTLFFWLPYFRSYWRLVWVCQRTFEITGAGVLLARCISVALPTVSKDWQTEKHSFYGLFFRTTWLSQHQKG